MGRPVIEVEGLSKLYRLGATVRHDTLRDTIAHGFRRLAGRGNAGGDTGRDGADSLWALKDVTFDVHEGEVLGIIGRNGAGKSTLLKLLSRITDPTSGRAVMRGRVASLLEVGTGFHPELTGAENIYQNGAILGMSRAEIKARFDEIVAFAEIEKFLDTPVKRYSSGMYVRLAFAVAAHLEPEILIVDEVLAVGDAAFQKKCMGKMEDVSRSGRTILFVSHNMGAVQRLCPRCALLDGGRLVYIGETGNTIDLYMSRTEEAAREGALENIPRQGGLGRSVRISKVDMLDSKGRSGNTIMFGEPFSMHMDAIAYEPLDGLSMVIGIDSASGFRITTAASEDTGSFFSARPGTSLSVSARFGELVLKPGRYAVTAGIRKKNEGLDQVLNVGRLEVVAATFDKDKGVSDSWGAVHTNVDWSGVDGQGQAGKTS